MPGRIELVSSKIPKGTRIDEGCPSDTTPSDHQDLSIGYDFEDQQTRAQLDLIDDLKKLGVESYLDLPQLVVVGDQSTGKSSVLQAVTEVPFETGDGMCTRFVTEIVLRRTLPDEPTETKVRIIPSIKDSSERKEKLMAWRPDTFDKFANLDKATMRGILKQANGVIFDKASKRNSTPDKTSTKTLSESILRITRSGPKETNFAIVDIPGLVRGKDNDPDRQTAIALVEKYLKNPRSIVVAVIDMVDWERHDITHMLKGLPDATSRVIGVINKCDLKYPNANDFIFDLLRNDQPESERYLKEGWFGLRNRNGSETEISDEERDKKENDLFSSAVWSSFDKNRLGRHALKRALIKMRNQHIKRSIPELISEIQSKLDICLAETEKLGQPRKTNHAQFTIVNKIAAAYSASAIGAIDGHYKGLSDEKQFARNRVRANLMDFVTDMTNEGRCKQFTTSEIDVDLIKSCPSEHGWAGKLLSHPTYAWINSAILKYRGNEDRGEINPIVKAKLWKEQTSGWGAMARNALDKIEHVVMDVNVSLFEKACPDENLRNKLQTWLHDDFQKATKDARHELERLLESESTGYVSTLNPHKEARQRQAQLARVQAILQANMVKNPEGCKPQSVGMDPLNTAPVPTDMVIETILNRHPDLIAVLSTHDCLAAHYEVALYHFIDNFAIQVVERHLLGPQGPLRLFTSDYVSERLYGEEKAAELNNLAGEDPEVAAKREILEAERLSLEASKSRVQAFKFL